ncbi:MAG: DNA repair protein RecO [Deltaproteobacteria bacterium]|nr:DNA repair protein RecO [Deltaproteobacteria bacterium]
MARPTHFTEALLLRSVDYRDADRIVTLLSRDHGPISALARGARKSRKRFGGSLEPCMLLRVELAETRGDLYRLASAEVKHHYANLASSLDSLRRAGAALRTLRALLPVEEPAEQAFASTLELFEHFDAHGSDRWQLLAFQFHLLALAGLTPDLERCDRCGREAPASRAVLLDAANGRVRCRDCGGAALYLCSAARHFIRAVTGPTFLDVEAPDERAWLQARGALEGLTAQHLSLELPGDPMD